MAQWQSIIKECKESGMTVAAFCEDRNISWHAYYYWLRKIREYIFINMCQEGYLKDDSVLEKYLPCDVNLPIEEYYTMTQPTGCFLFAVEEYYIMTLTLYWCQIFF